MLWEGQGGYVYQVAESHTESQSPAHRVALIGHMGFGNRSGNGIGVSSQFQLSAQGLGTELGLHGFHLKEDNKQIAYFFREVFYFSSAFFDPNYVRLLDLLPHPMFKVSLNPGVIYYPHHKRADFYSLSLDVGLPLANPDQAFAGYTVGLLFGVGLGGVASGKSRSRSRSTPASRVSPSIHPKRSPTLD